MGNGNFANGKFNLTINFFNHSPNADQLNQWKASFTLASKVLHEATYGQMQFGNLKLRFNGSAVAGDDIFIWNVDGESHKASTDQSYKLPGVQRKLPNKGSCLFPNILKKYSFVITHEFSHLALDLWDEYIRKCGVSIPSCCKTKSLYHACIMEFSRADGAYIKWPDGIEETSDTVNQFCSHEVSYHDDTTKHAQYYQHKGLSCWDIITNLLPQIGKPTQSHTPAGQALDPIVWERASAVKRIVYAPVGHPNLSGSVHDKAIKNSIHFWSNLVRNTGHQFGVVDSNNSEPEVVPLQTFEREKTEVTEAVNAIEFAQDGDANRAVSLANEMHVNGLDDPDSETILFVGSGSSDTLERGAIPKSLFESLIKNRTFLHSSILSKGPVFDDLEEYENEGWSSLNSFHDSSNNAEQALDFQTHQIQLGFDVVHHAGMNGYWADRLPESPNFQPIDDGNRDPAYNFETREDGIDYPVYVEEGSKVADFLVVLLDDQLAILEVIDPAGNPLTEEEMISLQHNNTDHYHWFRKIEPTPGRWIMRLKRTLGTEPIPFRLLAFSKHEEISVNFWTTPSQENSNTIHFVASSKKIFPLVGLEPPMVEIFEDDFQGAGRKRRIARFLLEQPTQLRQEAAIAGAAESIEAEDISEKPDQVLIANGTYLGEYTFDRPGIYTAVLRIANVGTATPASNSSGTINGNLSEYPMLPVENFVRFKQTEIRIP